MIQKWKENHSLAKLALWLIGGFGLYLIVAWASYSPLDNAWSVASTATQNVLNKTGFVGAWTIDLLYAFFGKVAFLVPFTMLGVSAYLLILKLASELTCKKSSLWALSFFCLMIGLAGLSSVLFSNSPYYLSGGFIGGLWQTLVGEGLGQVGVLLLAMLATAVGFYFCSGQLLLPLFTQFYDWIVGKNDAMKQPLETENSEQAVENEENIAPHSPIVKPFDPQNLQNSAKIRPLGDLDEQNDKTEENLTDLAQFKRPNISGLRPQTTPTMPSEPVLHSEKMAQEALVDPTMFKVERPLDLPKVNVQSVEPTPTSLTIGPTDQIGEGEEHEIVLPTIRLNPTIDNPVEPLSQNELTVQKLPETERKIEVKVEPIKEFNVTETTTETVVEPVPPQVKMPTDAGIERSQTQNQAINVNLLTDDKEPEKKPQAEIPHYPKGYGDTLIHPLLQKNKVVEKPTTPLPTLDLLDKHFETAEQASEWEIRETSQNLEKALANYGVKATVEDVSVGPVVTRYDIQLAAGVKATKVTGLAGDIARELMFQAIRITEKVPNKPYMGIEAPNANRETVWLRDVLDSDAFQKSTATLPMALGKDISGNPVVVDMAKMPHLLVAGQTGGGKSVGVNTMILSLLFKFKPEQLRFIMIDPKVVELSIYNDIPHLLTPVVTDMKQAAKALSWAVEEMERRYQLLSHLSVRNIEGYNGKIDEAEAMNFPIPDPTWRPGDTMDSLPPPLEKMGYIVVIVDEFADLMMSAGKEVEDYIMRIAQKARAVGIHLILATQRPSTDVITGVIKANIPSRIAFTVASQIDSRTILDSGGAEALLGRGDMLYSGAGSPDIIRVHGAFMTDSEVDRVADNWRARAKPNYLASLVNSLEESDAERGNREDLDPLFDEIVEFVIETGTASISGIQRRFSLGFNRAGRIVDQLEAEGIVSAPDSRNKREVLVR